jgi:hypothetical protein
MTELKTCAGRAPSMTLRLFLSLVTALVLAPGPSVLVSTQTLPQADPMASAIMQDLQSSLFGIGRATWQGRFPLVEWELPRGLIWRREWQPAPLWCAISRNSVAGMNREVLFYANRADLPLDCRLEQIRFEIPPAEAGAARYASLARIFTDQRGQPRTVAGPPSRDGSHLATLGIEYERYAGLDLWNAGDIMYWPGDVWDVYLFGYKGSLQVVARTTHIYTRWMPDRPLIDELVAAVSTRFPEAARLLPTPAMVDSAVVVRTVIPVLEALARATGDEERALLSLVASCLLEKLEIHFPHDQPTATPDVPELARHGVQLHPTGHGGDNVWGYDYGLVRRVVEAYPHLRWGQLAFIDMLSPERPHCETNYKDAIARIRRWLDEHPSSPLVSRVTFKMAQAYDSWWSLSLVPEEYASEEIVYAEEHMAGSADARIEAVGLYERFLRLDPTSPNAEEARRSLILLLNSADTRQRTFYCAIP